MDISLPALVSILALVILVGISCVNEDLNVGFLGIAFGYILQYHCSENHERIPA